MVIQSYIHAMYEAVIHHIGAAGDLIVHLVFHQSEVISYILEQLHHEMLNLYVHLQA